MSERFDYGPVQSYEITWKSGHVETALAHQVAWPQKGSYLASGLLGALPSEPGTARVMFHAEIDGRWVLTLSALEEDIRTIRNVTAGEQVPR